MVRPPLTPIYDGSNPCSSGCQVSAFAASCHSWRPPRRPLTHHARDPMAARVLVPMAIGLSPSPPWPASPWRLLLC